MKTILLLLTLALPTFAASPEARARAAYAVTMADEPAQESNVIAFDLSGLKSVPEQGEWRTVRVCDGNGYCHDEQRWFPSQGLVRTQADSTQFRSAASDSDINDALDELNAQRAQRGLPPYLRDDNLTRGAQAAANARAQVLLFEHTSNDFAYLPQGTTAAAAGCAAYPKEYGFMACAMYENWTYAGAAYAMGRDGKRYCHLFVR